MHTSEDNTRSWRQEVDVRSHPGLYIETLVKIFKKEKKEGRKEKNCGPV